MRVTVDEDACGGHGFCCQIAPAVFRLTDDGYAEVLTPQVPAEHQSATRLAATRCPALAITVHETTTASNCPTGNTAAFGGRHES